MRIQLETSHESWERSCLGKESRLSAEDEWLRLDCLRPWIRDDSNSQQLLRLRRHWLRSMTTISASNVYKSPSPIRIVLGFPVQGKRILHFFIWFRYLLLLGVDILIHVRELGSCYWPKLRMGWRPPPLPLFFSLFHSWDSIFRANSKFRQKLPTFPFVDARLGQVWPHHIWKILVDVVFHSQFLGLSICTENESILKRVRRWGDHPRVRQGPLLKGRPSTLGFFCLVNI